MGDGQSDTWHMVRAWVKSLSQPHVSLQVCHKVAVVEFVVVELEGSEVSTAPIDCQVDVDTIAQRVQQVEVSIPFESPRRSKMGRN